MTSHAAFATINEPMHRDAFALNSGTPAAEDLGIDEMLVTSPGVDVPPSRALTLADYAVSQLHDIYPGLVTPPPDA